MKIGQQNHENSVKQHEKSTKTIEDIAKKCENNANKNQSVSCFLNVVWIMETMFNATCPLLPKRSINSPKHDAPQSLVATPDREHFCLCAALTKPETTGRPTPKLREPCA